MSAEISYCSEEYHQMQRDYHANSESAQREAQMYWEFFLGAHPDNEQLRVQIGLSDEKEPVWRPITIHEGLDSHGEVEYGKKTRAISHFAQDAIERAVRATRDQTVQEYEQWLVAHRQEIETDFGAIVDKPKQDESASELTRADVEEAA